MRTISCKERSIWRPAVHPNPVAQTQQQKRSILSWFLKRFKFCENIGTRELEWLSLTSCQPILILLHSFNRDSHTGERAVQTKSKFLSSDNKKITRRQQKRRERPNCRVKEGWRQEIRKNMKHKMFWLTLLVLFPSICLLAFLSKICDFCKFDPYGIRLALLRTKLMHYKAAHKTRWDDKNI